MIKPSPPRGMSATQIHDARTDYSTVPDELRVEITRLQSENESLKEVIADHHRLVKELDVALNGEDGAAKQASLCDIVGQVLKEKFVPAKVAAEWVARECCNEILRLPWAIVETARDTTECYVSRDDAVDAIKQKYHIED